MARPAGGRLRSPLPVPTVPQSRFIPPLPHRWHFSSAIALLLQASAAGQGVVSIILRSVLVAFAWSSVAAFPRSAALSCRSLLGRSFVRKIQQVWPWQDSLVDGSDARPQWPRGSPASPFARNPPLEWRTHQPTLLSLSPHVVRV